MPHSSLKMGSTALVTVLAGIAAAGPAWAQDPPPPAATQEEQAQQSGFEDIIVTARKSNESQQDVPVSLTALTQEGLEQQNVLSVADLQTAVPGLTVAVNSQGGAPTFAIRAAKGDNGTSNTVTTYINDMPTTTTQAVANMVYDMQSITTLKGPQGTLFGANSTGGAIIFRPNTPSNEFEGYIEAGAGNFDRRYLEAMINIPASDILQFRLAGNLVRRDGFVTNNATPAQRGLASKDLSNDRHESARLTIRFKPATTVQNDTLVSYYNEDSTARQAIPVFLRPRYNYPTFLGFSVPVDYAKAGFVASPNERNVILGPDPTYSKARIWDVTNTTTIDLSTDLTFKLALGYEHARLDTFDNNSGLVGRFVNGRTLDILRQYTVEPSFDFTGADGRLRLKVGGFYSDMRRTAGNSYAVIGLPFDFVGFPPFLTPVVQAFLPLLASALYIRDTESKAVFGQVAYDITDKLTASVGARYTWDEGKYAANNYNGFGAAATAAGIGGFDSNNGLNFCSPGLATYKNFNPATCTGHQDLKTSSPSFTGVLDYKFARNQMLYVTARSGYLVGGFNNQVYVAGGFAQVFRPEKVMDFEVGLKSDGTVGGRPVRTNLDIFYGKYKNQQRVQNGTSSTGIGFIAVQNAGKSHFYGGDAEIVFSVTDELDLSANYQYIRAVYDEYQAPLSIPGVNLAFVDFAGEKLAQTPDHVLNLSATYKVPLPSDNGSFSATATYFWRSSTTGHDGPTVSGPVLPSGELQTITTDFTQFDKLPGFGLVNASVDWDNVMGSNFSVRLWVKNLFDKTYATYQSNQLLQFGYATYNYGNPREFGVNARFTF